MNKARNKIIGASVITMLPGIMVIMGWLFHNNFLRSVVPGAVTMKFNVALGLVFSSTALLLYYFPGRNKIRYHSFCFTSVYCFSDRITYTGRVFLRIQYWY